MQKQYLVLALAVIAASGLYATAASAGVWSDYTPYTVGSASSNSPFVTVTDNTGYVGIGTESPKARLDVSGGQDYNIATVYAGRQLQVSDGSTSDPVTIGRPTMKISKVENLDSAECASNRYNTVCNSALTVSSLSLGGNMQTSAIDAHAATISTISGTDAFAINARGSAYQNAVGVAAGAYLQGQRSTPKAFALGAEITTWNYSSTDCGYNPKGFSKCMALWLVSRGLDGSDTSSALQIEDFQDSQFRVGLGVNPGSVLDITFHDNSSSRDSIRIEGTHTNALLTGPTAGSVGIGTLTPQSKFHVTSGKNATTTITLGELNDLSSKACVNMNRSNGQPASFYINGAGVMVVETKYCN